MISEAMSKYVDTINHPTLTPPACLGKVREFLGVLMTISTQVTEYERELHEAEFAEPVSAQAALYSCHSRVRSIKMDLAETTRLVAKLGQGLRDLDASQAGVVAAVAALTGAASAGPTVADG